MASRVRGSVCKVGVNDTQDTTQVFTGGKLVWACPFYKKWKAMLDRCYGDCARSGRANYEQTTVYQDWWLFSKFKDWLEDEYSFYKKSFTLEELHLDKDILANTENTYSPNTTRLLPKKVNTLLLDSGRARGGFPLGVDFHNGRFRARGRENSKAVYLGAFHNPLLAHHAWAKHKASIIREACLQSMLKHDIKSAMLARAAFIDKVVERGGIVVNIHKTPWSYLGVADEFKLDDDTWDVILAEESDGTSF